MLGLAKSLSIRINKLVERIGEIRRELFSTLLTKRYQIDLTLIGEVADAFYVETAEFLRTVSITGCASWCSSSCGRCCSPPSSRWRRRRCS